MRRQKMFLRWGLLLLQFFLTPCMQGGTCVPREITSLWIQYRNVNNDSTRILFLSRLAFRYENQMNDHAMADKLADAAVGIAELNLRPGLLLLAYNLFMESTDPEFSFKKSEMYGTKSLQLCRIGNNAEFLWRTNINLARVYASRYDFDNALYCANEALSQASALKNDTMIAESYLNIGNSLAFRDRKIQAYRNYLMAKAIAEKTGNPRLLKKCHARLYTFYQYYKLYDEALESKRHEGFLVLTMKPVDSTALMWIRYEMYSIDVALKNGGPSENGVLSAIDFAIRTCNQRLRTYFFALYRKALLERDDVEKLYELYIRKYPTDFKYVADHDPSLYYRLKAYFAELEHKPDSADFYFHRSEILLAADRNPNNLFRSVFYLRFGQFLVRQGRKQEAIGMFTRSFRLAESDRYPGRFDFIIDPCKQLESLYRELGDYKNAWYYAAVSRQFFDSISRNSRSDQILAESLRRERSEREITAEKDRQEIRQGKARLYVMAGGVVVALLMLLLANRNYRNQKRLNRLIDEEKRRSEELLLNILPVETAEELKKTGQASARRFNEVTVMFTDFKNFTQASEQMSAEDLVKVINYYFSEFDNIISRYNIEKIKIIGDSYMCAGGLPVPTPTHAADVVHAAIDMQAFMAEERVRRTAAGEPWFELRIGIHTGPVVAGIVGHKKFAYDIWGDTVNTASRLENCGEPNRINISGETFERVKDLFPCTYRGKVAAKHKGEIDMYFVETGG